MSSVIKFPAFLCFMNPARFFVPRELKIPQDPSLFCTSWRYKSPEFPAFLCFEKLPRPEIQHFVLHEPQIHQMSSIYVLRQPHISNIFCFREPQCCGCVKMEPLVLLAFFLVWNQVFVMRSIMVLLVFPLFCRHFGCLWVLPKLAVSFSTPIMALSTLQKHYIVEENAQF